VLNRNQHSDAAGDAPKPAPKKGRFTKVLLVAVGLYLVFSLGVGVGRGTITLGSGSIFRKSVSTGLPKQLDFSSVQEMYSVLRSQFDGQLDEEELLDGLKRGLASATGDPYTEFLNAQEAEEFNGDLNGTFSGIGAELAKDDKNIIIVAPISGFPAQKAGLRAQDIIAEIDGESAYDLTTTEAVKKIRGEAGTKVKLKIIRDNEQLDFEITRATITIPSVESEILEGNIGYLKVSRFSEDTDALARKAASEFKQKNVRGVVLDLRNNPGGLLDSSVSLSSLWLPKGKTVLLEKRDGVTIRTYTSDGTATLAGVPTVVLINEGSASASEITAGALHDNTAATLMGMQTFGKGSVQSLERLPSGGVLKVTIARWFTPNGKNIDKEGIAPDKEVKPAKNDFTDGRDSQKDAALQFLKK
jgi:carboxyl-terminal processing protease